MIETKTDILKGVYQIWYDEQTKSQISDCFCPFENPKLTPFFENSVIADLIKQGKHLETDWFGVLSPNFFYKQGRSGPVTPNFIREKLNEHIDLLTFTNSQNANVITQGDKHHGVRGTFSKVVQSVFEDVGIEWNVRNRLDFPVLMNYVIARGWVWDKYYKEMLAPCMEAMENAAGEFRELLWQDAKYQKTRPGFPGWVQMKARLKKQIGVDYYPLHTFICERLWSVFLQMNPGIRKRKYVDR